MISLYIHIPFCVGKCLYCGFYSTPYSAAKADEFLAALRIEADGMREKTKGLVVGTVYIGGGTPSMLTEGQADALLDLVRTSFAIAEDAEFTVEVNPSSATEAKLARWRKGGANRLSLGVQSFSDEVLRSIGRPHDAVQAYTAYSAARNAGFANISLDLLYGIPGQTSEQWRDSLAAAADAGSEHISLYCLSLDDGSRFARDAEAGQFVLPDDDRAAEMYEQAVELLARAGYGRYEVSNFAQRGFACRHNEHYWERGEYLGLGPAAWSFFNGKRCCNIADLDRYSKNMFQGESAVCGCEIPGPEEASRETLFLALRTMKGLDLTRYEREYGTTIRERLERAMTPLMTTGLLRLEQGALTLTERGIMLSNEVVSRLFP